MKAKENTFKQAIIHSIPIGLGYFVVSFAFGIYCIANGLSVWEATAISMTNLTSAGQMAAIPIITSGGSLIELASTQLIINSRYFLMSISLTQKFDEKITFWDKLFIAFGNTDEIFAMDISNKHLLSKQYMCGMILMPWLGWSSGTLLGAIAGDILPKIITESLSLAIYAMLIAVVLPETKFNKNVLICVLLSIVLSLGFTYLPSLKNITSGFRIVIIAIIACTIMALVFPIKEDNNND